MVDFTGNAIRDLPMQPELKWLRKPRYDSVSAFFLKGKVKALRLIQGDAEYAKSLKVLGDSFTVDEVNFLAVEKFVYIHKLYGQMDATSVNDVRFDMFKKANRMESTMPPNNDALRQHILRANFQARIYKLSLMKNQDLPSPSEHGWIFDDGHLAIHWMSLPPAPESIIELGNCSCKKNKCQLPNAGDSCCISFGLPCTDLCQCKGCENISQMILEIEEDLDTDEDDQMELLVFSLGTAMIMFDCVSCAQADFLQI
ncbi:hypothetical protein BSL78_04803 [Apostichopus japonicus]|uniref:Tesmin/TSO1-like CXC domain-containing protein n=1 Tax=Stichopus japonicus TaxID=307972 RepID=A0A2G8LDJ9_STIJA|nr:hypothetical protein BSL78_04803 [Apostichopus japonicus]